MSTYRQMLKDAIRSGKEISGSVMSRWLAYDLATEMDLGCIYDMKNDSFHFSPLKAAYTREHQMRQLIQVVR